MRNLPIAVLFAALVLVLGCGSKRDAGNLDALLAEGWQAYTTGDFDYAIGCFEDARSVRGASPEQTYSAILGLATVYHLQSNPDLARAREYYAMLAGLNTPDALRQSALGLARVDLAEGRTAEAQSKLTAVIRDYPDSSEADEATIHLAESLFAPRPNEEAPGGFDVAGEASMRRGLQVLEDRLSSHAQNPLASAMHMMLANKYIELRQFDKAVQALLGAEKDGIAVERLRSVAVWRIARIAELELKDYELAERYSALYVKDFGRTELYYRALESLERVRTLKAQSRAQTPSPAPGKGA